MIDQSVIDLAVNMASRAALNGTPVERIVWLPPQTTSSAQSGAFAIAYCRPLTGSETPPWER